MQALKSASVRVALLGGALLLLGGCGLPPAVAIGSYVVDAGSFVTTGKTATDHGISAVADEDCMLMRMLEGPVCQPEAEYQMAEDGVLQPLAPKPLAEQQAGNRDSLAGLGYVADEGLAMEALVRSSAGAGL